MQRIWLTGPGLRQVGLNHLHSPQHFHSIFQLNFEVSSIGQLVEDFTGNRLEKSDSPLKISFRVWRGRRCVFIMKNETESDMDRKNVLKRTLWLRPERLFWVLEFFIEQSQRGSEGNHDRI